MVPEEKATLKENDLVSDNQDELVPGSSDPEDFMVNPQPHAC
jgi:hypothetical protein